MINECGAVSGMNIGRGGEIEFTRGKPDSLPQELT
jgi:hypothetical protein